METSLKKFLDSYLNFKIVGKKVTLPYWMNKLEQGIYGPLGGKGTPEKLRELVIESAKESGLGLKKMSGEEIHLFMKEKRLGLDCSGFAYQILNFLDLERGGDGLENSVIGVNGQMGISKTNADTITNADNSFPIEGYQQIKAGDMIRLNGGKHIAVITEVNDKEIIYIHISAFTKVKGPHLDRIKIINPELDLGGQEWSEKVSNGANYKDGFFHPNLGDGIRRLKIFA